MNKKAREQFQLCAYKKLMDIYSSSSKTIDALMKLELPSGVDVEVVNYNKNIKMAGIIGKKIGMTSVYELPRVKTYHARLLKQDRVS